MYIFQLKLRKNIAYKYYSSILRSVAHDTTFCFIGYYVFVAHTILTPDIYSVVGGECCVAAVVRGAGQHHSPLLLPGNSCARL